MDYCIVLLSIDWYGFGLWIKDYGASLGVFVTVALFIIQRWIQSQHDYFTFISQKEAYLYSLADEVRTIKNLMTSNNKMKESDFEIFDVVFPKEAYVKFPLETQRLEIGSVSTIREFYNVISIRNELYLLRINIRHNFFDNRGLNVDSWFSYVSGLDFKIKSSEDFMGTVIQNVIDTVSRNLNDTIRIRKSVKTKFGVKSG